MTTLIVSRSEVRRLLPMGRCIELMAEALATLGRGEAENPLRWPMRLPEGRGVLGLMPGCMESPSTLGLKIVSIFPGNPKSGYDSHQGVVVLLDPEHGFPTAILDASEITAIRTAAVSGLATRLLAREDASDLAILGTGVQACSHLEAMLEVRDVRRVRVWGPTPEHRQAYAKGAAAGLDVPVEAVDSAREAVDGADLICTVTAAREPILHGEWLAPGAHVNAVGSSVASARELDTRAVAAARLFVDRRESALVEAGDFLIPKQEGAIGDDHIQGEIGELLLGQLPGRQTAEEITLFKSLGLAVEDLQAAHFIVEQARQAGLGTEVEIGIPPLEPEARDR